MRDHRGRGRLRQLLEISFQTHSPIRPRAAPSRSLPCSSTCMALHVPGPRCCRASTTATGSRPKPLPTCSNALAIGPRPRPCPRWGRAAGSRSSLPLPMPTADTSRLEDTPGGGATFVGHVYRARTGAEPLGRPPDARPRAHRQRRRRGRRQLVRRRHGVRRRDRAHRSATSVLRNVSRPIPLGSHNAPRYIVAGTGTIGCARSTRQLASR